MHDSPCTNESTKTTHLLLLCERDYIPITFSICTRHGTSVSSDKNLNEIMKPVFVHLIAHSYLVILLKLY